MASLSNNPVKGGTLIELGPQTTHRNFICPRSILDFFCYDHLKISTNSDILGIEN